MKITIFTLGTRGDVQPFLALAVGLKKAGHDVTVAASYNFTDWIKSYGVNAYSISWSAAEFFSKPEVLDALQSSNIMRVFSMMRDGLTPGFIQANDDLWEAGKNADLVVQTIPLLCGVEVAQHRNIPMINAYATPVYTPPTREFPWFGLPWRFSLGKTYNYLTHVLLHNFPGSVTPLNKWRKSRLNLPPLRSNSEALNPDRCGYPTPSLYALSPTIIPKPRDWGSQHHVAGYWFLDALENASPPEELQTFLANGAAPVYIGFGSMSDRKPEYLVRVAIDALEKTGQRGVIETSWEGVKNIPLSESIYILNNKNVTHDWLFPRMAAIVHHGGAGTTAAALRAGVPSMVTPFTLDQYAWGGLVVQTGTGPHVVSNVKKLTTDKLVRAIATTVNNPEMKRKAEEIGKKIRAEDGINHAVKVIEEHAAGFYRRAQQISGGKLTPDYA